jgi:hypothetical protein
MHTAPLLTLRSYLIIKMASEGWAAFMAVEAVSTTLMAHNDWDPNEERTWKDWEKRV